MREVKRGRLVATVTALAIGLIGPAFIGAPAGAVEPDSNDAVQWYVDNGVDVATAEALIAEIEDGDLPDSITDGGSPTSVSQYVEDGFTVTRNEYSDGSLSITKVEIATELSSGVSPMSVYGCVSVPGSGYVAYYNCLVLESNSAYLDLGFEADYTRYSSGVGTINAIRNPYAYAFVGTAGTPSISILKATSNSSGPAQAQAFTQWHGPISSFTAYTYLNVNGSSAWSSKAGF